MAEPIKEDVVRAIGSIEVDLQDIIFGAWQDWLGGSEYGRTRFNRTRANIVWDRIIDRAYEKFSDNNRIDIVEKDNTVLFVLLNERTVFRFEKGDDRGLSNNYPTQTAFDFHDQNIPLFGDMGLCRVEVVYVLNKLETQVDSILIVARHEDSILWAHDITPQSVAVEVPQAEKQDKLFVDQLVRAAEYVQQNRKIANEVEE